MNVLILRTFLILRKFPHDSTKFLENSKNKIILRIRMLVNTGPVKDFKGYSFFKVTSSAGYFFFWEVHTYQQNLDTPSGYTES